MTPAQRRFPSTTFRARYCSGPRHTTPIGSGLPVAESASFSIDLVPAIGHPSGEGLGQNTREIRETLASHRGFEPLLPP
jgi:hypothetical protein